MRAYEWCYFDRQHGLGSSSFEVSLMELWVNLECCVAVACSLICGSKSSTTHNGVIGAWYWCWMESSVQFWTSRYNKGLIGEYLMEIIRYSCGVWCGTYYFASHWLANLIGPSQSSARSVTKMAAVGAASPPGKVLRAAHTTSRAWCRWPARWHQFGVTRYLTVNGSLTWHRGDY